LSQVFGVLRVFGPPNGQELACLPLNLNDFPSVLGEGFDLELQLACLVPSIVGLDHGCSPDKNIELVNYTRVQFVSSLPRLCLDHVN
jgi:hypothetical protein